MAEPDPSPDPSPGMDAGMGDEDIDDGPEEPRDGGMGGGGDDIDDRVGDDANDMMGDAGMPEGDVTATPPPDGDAGRGTLVDSGGGGTPCNSRCADDEVCFTQGRMGECISEAEAKCLNAPDKGTISPGESITIQDSFSNYRDDKLQTSCAAGGDNANHPEKVYRFSVTENTQIDVSSAFGLSGNRFDAKLEFRQGGCSPAKLGPRGSCRDSDGMFFAPKGSTFHLVVEADVGLGGDFKIDLTGQPACSFGDYGEYACKQGDRYLCERKNQQPNETKFACGGGCKNGSCLGDSCSNPVTIQAGSNVSKTFTGDLKSYSAEMNFADAGALCTVQGTKAETRGPEVIYKITGVQQGQTIKVDTTADSNANYTFIANNCKSASNISDIACAATGLDEVEMQASSSGTYYIYIDKGPPSANPFEYTISVQ